jgi:hypothetical protein
MIMIFEFHGLSFGMFLLYVERFVLVFVIAFDDDAVLYATLYKNNDTPSNDMSV